MDLLLVPARNVDRGRVGFPLLNEIMAFLLSLVPIPLLHLLRVHLRAQKDSFSGHVGRLLPLKCEVAGLAAKEDLICIFSIWSSGVTTV